MAASDNVDIVFAHHHDGNVPGDRASVPQEEARKLVRYGRAHYATKADAVATEGDAGADKTVAAAKSKQT